MHVIIEEIYLGPSALKSMFIFQIESIYIKLANVK